MKDRRALIIKHQSLINEIYNGNKDSVIGDVNFLQLASGQVVFTSNFGHLIPKDEIKESLEGVKYFLKHVESYLTYINTIDPNEFNEALIENHLKLSEERVLRREAQKKDEKKTFVYLMLNQRNGHYKIGRSNNPQFREDTLCSQEPEITTLHIIDSTKTLEKELHLKFADKRIRGEWFALNTEDVELIKSL